MSNLFLADILTSLGIALNIVLDKSTGAKDVILPTNSGTSVSNKVEVSVLFCSRSICKLFSLSINSKIPVCNFSISSVEVAFNSLLERTEISSFVFFIFVEISTLSCLFSISFSLKYLFIF